MGPKESSLGLHCTSVQSLGLILLEGAGWDRFLRSWDLLPQELGRGDGMREG